MSFSFVFAFARFNCPESNLPGSRGTRRTRSARALCLPAKARGGRGRGAHAPWRTSKPVPSRPGPSARPLLLLQPLAPSLARQGTGCSLRLGYRIAAVDDEPESIQGLLSPEEIREEENQGEEIREEENQEKEKVAKGGKVLGGRTKNRLNALIRQEHNYSVPM